MGRHSHPALLTAGMRQPQQQQTSLTCLEEVAALHVLPPCFLQALLRLLPLRHAQAACLARPLPPSWLPGRHRPPGLPAAAGAPTVPDSRRGGCNPTLACPVAMRGPKTLPLLPRCPGGHVWVEHRLLRQDARLGLCSATTADGYPGARWPVLPTAAAAVGGGGQQHDWCTDSGWCTETGRVGRCHEPAGVAEGGQQVTEAAPRWRS